MSDNLVDTSSNGQSKNQSSSQSSKRSKRHHSSKKHEIKKKHISSSESESESDSEDSATTDTCSISSSESSNRYKKRSKKQVCKRRKPLCRKCKAHGKDVSLKMHKRRCPYKECQCSACHIVNYERYIVAKEIALYRFGIFLLISQNYLCSVFFD